MFDLAMFHQSSMYRALIIDKAISKNPFITIILDYLGCFIDKHNNRDMELKALKNQPALTIEKCVAECRNKVIFLP